MANTNAPFGFIPCRHFRGGVLRPNNAGQYYIASAYNTALYAGDVVILTNAGPYVNRASNSDALLVGVFRGVQFINPLDQRPWWTDSWIASQATVGSLDALADIQDDPDTVYQVQCLTGTAAAVSIVGNNAPLEATAGNSLTHRSAESLSVATTTTGTDQFRILNLAPLPGNAWGDSAIVEVKFNKHLYLTVTGN